MAFWHGGATAIGATVRTQSTRLMLVPIGSGVDTGQSNYPFTTIAYKRRVLHLGTMAR